MSPLFLRFVRLMLAGVSLVALLFTIIGRLGRKDQRSPVLETKGRSVSPITCEEVGEGFAFRSVPFSFLLSTREDLKD